MNIDRKKYYNTEINEENINEITKENKLIERAICFRKET